MHPLTRCPPPAPPPPISDEEEVPDNKEGVDDTAAGADVARALDLQRQKDEKLAKQALASEITSRYHGEDAALAASMFHYAETSVRSLKQHLRQHGIPVRL